MAKYRHVYTSFWDDPKVVENFTPEDRYFYLYLLTNSHTTQIGIYKLPKRLISFELGYTQESVRSILDRFINHHELIKYNDDTNEIAILNWGKYNLNASGKPVLDLITKELKEVEDRELLDYILSNTKNEAIRGLFISALKNRSYFSEIVMKEDTSNEPLDVPYHEPTHDAGDKTKTKTKTKIKTNIYTQTEPQTVSVDNVDNSNEGDKSLVAPNVPIETSNVPYEKIIELFNNTCQSLPKVKARTKQRDKSIKSIWLRFNSSLQELEKYFIAIEKSDFLTNRNNASGWSANFDWILKPSNQVKIVEGNYDNKLKSNNTTPPKGAFNNFEQREYDYDDLEKRLLGWK